MEFVCPKCQMKLDLSNVPPGSQFMCPGCSSAYVRPFAEATPTPPPPMAGAPLGGPGMPPSPQQLGQPPKTIGMAIASLILAIVSAVIPVLFPLAIVAIILGFVAMSKVSKAPRLYTGRGLALAGVIVGFAGIFFAIILALIAIPNFMAVRAHAYNASAQASGYNAKIAEEVYRQNNGADQSGHFTDRLAELLKWDKNLTNDPEVTFVFGNCAAQGYTFTTTHAKGDASYLTTD